MGLKRALSYLAAMAPVPVFPVIGAGGRDLVRRLELDCRIRVVDSPRAANVLVAAGRVTAGLLRPALQIHDQLSHPRATVWRVDVVHAGRVKSVFPAIRIVGRDGELVDAIRGAWDDLLRDRVPSEPPALPDVDPAPWRGVGPYGHGGTGMTGGVPYGRPMAVRAGDRDGLSLDEVPVRIGPFFRSFPPGLTLDAKLHGDVIQDASVAMNPFLRGHTESDLFAAALERPVRVADLEIERARHHLHWAADGLRIHGMAALGRRVRRLAYCLESTHADAVRRLGRTLQSVRGISLATGGVGLIPEHMVRDASGPVGRASGVPNDARAAHPAYQSLGFAPLVEVAGDARARWRLRLREAVQSLELAARAGDRLAEPTGEVETPRGRLTAESNPVAALLEQVPALVAGQEWGDAVTTIVSLDLDLEAAAA